MNLSAILQNLGIDRTNFNADLENQFPRDTEDYSYIENESEWINQVVPDHLTQFVAKQIFNEIIELKFDLIQEESVREGRQLDLENEIRD